MSECCCPHPTDTSPKLACPACQSVGSRVGELTVKALLTEVALQRFEPGDYRFCGEPTCPVVYCGANAAFTTEDLRVPVWQKQVPGHRTVCYCFGENEADIHAEVQQTGQSLAVDRVRQHIAAGRCACDVRNPKGSCCLGDVTQAVKRATVDG